MWSIPRPHSPRRSITNAKAIPDGLELVTGDIILRRDRPATISFGVPGYSADDLAVYKRVGTRPIDVQRPPRSGDWHGIRPNEVAEGPRRVIVNLDTCEYLDPEKFGQFPTLAGMLAFRGPPPWPKAFEKADPGGIAGNRHRRRAVHLAHPPAAAWRRRHPEYTGRSLDPWQQERVAGCEQHASQLRDLRRRRVLTERSTGSAPKPVIPGRP